jgi:hypothetical protein
MEIIRERHVEGLGGKGGGTEHRPGPLTTAAQPAEEKGAGAQL